MTVRDHSQPTPHKEIIAIHTHYQTQIQSVNEEIVDESVDRH